MACDLLGVPDGPIAIVVACSGGADSAAALRSMRAARPRAELVACYVDHRVRPKASIERDRRAVRSQARACDARHASVGLHGADDEGSSLEARLRARRYRALAAFARAHGSRIVVTGHQRDDVAESSLMAMLRGSGVDGIAAMRPRRPIGAGVDVVRPLLWAPKRVLERYVRVAGLTVSEDETNDDVSLRRNAVRKTLARLEAIAPGTRESIARSAAIAHDDKSLLDAVAASAWKRVRSADGASLVAAALRRLPDALMRRVLRIEVRRVAGSARDFTYAHCAAIAAAVRGRRGGTFHAGRAVVELSAGRARFSETASTSRASRPASASVAFEAPRSSARIAWRGGELSLRRVAAGKKTTTSDSRAATPGSVVYLDAAAVPAGLRLVVRAPKSGDRFIPAGRRREVGVARFLAKAGIARSQRNDVPLLCANGSIAAAVGVRASAVFAALPGRRAIEVRWESGGRPAQRRR
jgi:tRNA(Ile)-lysidine synthase